MNGILIEFSNICKHEEILTKNECINYFNNDCINFIKNHDDILFVLNCEYEAPIKECTLNYYNKYWGNSEFNDLLKKYNLRYEWYNESISFIYKDYDFVN